MQCKQVHLKLLSIFSCPMDSSEPETDGTKSFGGDSAWVPPVPIPNTVVKPCCADGTAGSPLWESRKPPDYPKASGISRGLSFYIPIA